MSPPIPISTRVQGNPSNYEVKISPSKGLGVFANRPIQAGTPIISETPMMSVSMPEMVSGQGFRLEDMLSELQSAFLDLSFTQQELVLSLHDLRFPGEEKQSRVLTIFRSNAYLTGDDRIGLFPNISRINHSCRPNAGNWWSEMKEERLIYAQRDIEEGEEITVSYIPLLKRTRERHSRLQQYGFVCDCSACSEDSETSDRLRGRIETILGDLELKLGKKSSKLSINEKRVKKAEKLAQMIEDESLWDYSSKAYHLAAVFNSYAGRSEEAKKWAKLERKVLSWAEEGTKDWIGNVELMKSLEDK